ncbi:IS66 family transposase [Methylorubrum populi]|uniref:Mobile element protein n=1 Tax=Methylorubrum populi TaxID=223967 RepID=A0A833J4F1_9HYPH|nr:Mobile element protein [Methylorubrum populi]
MPRTVPEGWVSHRVDRGGRRASPVFFASPDRRGERPLAHLAGCSGALVADGDAGFNAPYEKARRAACCPSDPALTRTGRVDPLRASARPRQGALPVA